jgi:hypothetical protein
MKDTIMHQACDLAGLFLGGVAAQCKAGLQTLTCFAQKHFGCKPFCLVRDF